MKTFKLAVFDRPAPIRMVVRELDTVLEAVWAWEVTNYGHHPNPFRGRAVFEAVMELQEWVMTQDE